MPIFSFVFMFIIIFVFVFVDNLKLSIHICAKLGEIIIVLFNKATLSIFAFINKSDVILITFYAHIIFC